MARCSLTIVQRIVYDNLGVTLQASGYGNLDTTNKRYLSGYVNDLIAEADIDTMMFLFKNKQNTLLRDGASVTASLASGGTVPNNWIIIDVTIDGELGTEVSVGMYEQLAQGGIYDTSTYKGYYALKTTGGQTKIFYIGTPTSAVITYFDVTHPSTLTVLLSPTGFEGAVANLASSLLLMKRGDKPEQSKFYMELYQNFMQNFMAADSNEQNIISD